jgi:signal peptidase I
MNFKAVLTTISMQIIVKYKSIIKRILSYLILFITIFLLAVCLRVFVFEIYTIPSSSMANTLITGDKILVSKLNYGPRLPRSPFEIPWVNIFFYLNKKTRAKNNTTWWKYNRLPGFSEINRGDVIVFEFPDNKNEAFVKRCVALPVDTFRIINSDVFINNRIQKTPVDLKMVCRLWYNNISRFDIIIDSLNIPNYGLWTREKGSFRVISLSERQKEQLTGIACIDSITSRNKTIDFTTQYYPWHDGYTWTLDNMGPFIIPGKEFKIKPDKNNIILYKKILEKFEHAGITNDSREWHVNDSVVCDYGFKQDYYFMLGDNRNASNDSRYWGFVPEDHIIGKVCFVLFSLDPGKKGLRKIRWNRMFKKIK